MIIYTDYSAVMSISWQISLLLLSINKLNLHLVQASQYLLQFNLKVRHKAEKSNIVSDALSYLQGSQHKDHEIETLNKLCVEAFKEIY